MQVIIDLRAVCIREFRHSLQFNNYLAKANKICFVGLFQVLTFVTYGKLLLTFERNTS